MAGALPVGVCLPTPLPWEKMPMVGGLGVVLAAGWDSAALRGWTVNGKAIAEAVNAVARPIMLSLVMIFMVCFFLGFTW